MKKTIPQQPFQVGEFVTSVEYSHEAEIVRRITRVNLDKRRKDPWEFVLDGGKKCSCCGRTDTYVGCSYESQWLRRVETKPEMIPFGI